MKTNSLAHCNATPPQGKLMDDEIEINPYASPTVDAGYTPDIAEARPDGLWRDNRDLVMHRQSRLPNICVKSGVPTAEPGITRKLSWHTPWLSIAVLINVIVYVVLSLVFSKKAEIAIPLSPEERGKRQKWIAMSWIGGSASMIVFGLSVYLSLNSRNAPPFAILGLLGGIGGSLVALLVGNAKARILRPTKITDTHVWLRGVHESILDTLPPMPPIAKS